MRHKGLTLLMDADDTLWENNVYFQEIIRTFCELLEARGHPPRLARDALNRTERARTKTDGYGVKNFHASLRQACTELLSPADHQRELATLDGLCGGLARRSLIPIAGVAATLRELYGRHRVILFTKGDLDDQLGKVHRSGLRPYLHQIDVVREKNVETYRDAILRHGIRPLTTWMVGNSPVSDIHPALDAGLGAVFIPHPSTWELEQGELPAPAHGRLLVLERFSQLTEHF